MFDQLLVILSSTYLRAENWSHQAYIDAIVSSAIAVTIRRHSQWKHVKFKGVSNFVQYLLVGEIFELMRGGRIGLVKYAMLNFWKQNC